MSRTHSQGPSLNPLRLVPTLSETEAEGEPVDITPMVKMVAEHVAQRHRSGVIVLGTARGQLYTLLSFADSCGNRTIKQIGQSDIYRWLETTDGDEPSTRARKFRTVRDFFEQVLDGDRAPIRRNPCRGIKPLKTPPGTHRAFTADQVARLLTCAPDAMARVEVLLGVQSGLRASETAGAQLGNLNWSAQRLKVLGKGHKERIVPVPDEAMEAIDAYLTERAGARTRGPLLRQRRFPARGVTAAYVSEEFSALAYTAGLKQGPNDGISYHALRHTAATDINRKCGNAVMVRDILGHSDIATTDRYLGTFPLDELAEAMSGRRYSAGSLLAA